MTSLAPGQVATPDTLLSADRLRVSSDAALAQTAAAILAEQHRRALVDTDIGALLEQAFVDGFADDGTPNIPWIIDGLLLCPGYHRRKSATSTSHVCTFTLVDGVWSWDHDAVVIDDMRNLPGPAAVKQSITILPCSEGMEVGVVTSKGTQGDTCEMKKGMTFQVQAGELVLVSTRVRSTPRGHGGE